MKFNWNVGRTGTMTKASFGRQVAQWAGMAAIPFCCAGNVWTTEESDTATQLRQLKEQNERLLSQVGKQQELIDALSKKMDGFQKTQDQREKNVGELKEDLKAPSADPLGGAKLLSTAKLSLSGEAGFAFFKSGSQGQFPHGEFRVDEARLFLEAEVGQDVYTYLGLDLATREDNNVRLGEAYVDFENVSKLWHHDRQVNLRFGRFYIPFGEEYQLRNAIDNPLISHSLGDLWGPDEGLALYGSLGKFHYIVAVQNGGPPSLDGFASDKSIAGRVGFEPAKWLHLSASAMRTGDISAQNDSLSEMWFGNGFFRALGKADTTTEFHANLVEGDVHVRLRRGHLKAAGGYVRFGDDDTTADNKRNVYYYYTEGLFDVTPKLYAAARFSQIIAPDGFPIVGNGDFDNYFFNQLTTDLWRLSLGVGYRLGSSTVLKAEYSFERGKELGGEKRDNEDLFGFEVAVKF
jgi:hypothetical protein